MTENRHLSDRRKFIKNTAALSLLAAVFPDLANAAIYPDERREESGDGFTFLFQGDSITDAGRSHDMDWNHVLGQGYAYLISSRLWLDHPKKSLSFLTGGLGAPSFWK